MRFRHLYPPDALTTEKCLSLSIDGMNEEIAESALRARNQSNLSRHPHQSFVNQ